MQISASATSVRPLLVFGPEGTVIRRADATGIQQLAGELDGNRWAAVGASVLGQSAAGHARRQLFIHHPQGKSNVVPPQVAEAAQRFQVAADANVAREELLRTFEAELTRNSADGSHRYSVVDDLTHEGEALAVHEHD